MSKDFFKKYYLNLNNLFSKIEYNYLLKAAKQINLTKKKSGKIIIAGNGGSAGIASHAAIDFTKVAGYRAINFNESSTITCLANDYGYENWLKMAIKFYAEKNDTVILISSSGKSKNMINAALQAKKLGNYVITFSGFSKKNKLKSKGNLNFWVDSKHYNFIENTHQIWLLSIIDYLIFNKSK